MDICEHELQRIPPASINKCDSLRFSYRRWEIGVTQWGSIWFTSRDVHSHTDAYQSSCDSSGSHTHTEAWSSSKISNHCINQKWRPDQCGNVLTQLLSQETYEDLERRAQRWINVTKNPGCSISHSLWPKSLIPQQTQINLTSVFMWKIDDIV